MRRSLLLCSVGLIGGLLGSSTAAMADEATKTKGAKTYCYLRSSGNDHTVSWNAAYALIKRQGRSMFKTSPEHASVMITEAVVNDPGSYPDCGRYLGDLFGGSSSTTAIQPSSTINGSSSTAPTNAGGGYATNNNDRYSY